MDHRSRTTQATHHPTRNPDQPGPSRRTTANTLNRVERACAQLRHDGHPVTFTAVATHTGLGRTTLYRDPTLRAVIDQHRHHTSGTLTALTDEIATLRTTLEAIATRVRHHEEQLRRLTGQKPENKKISRIMLRQCPRRIILRHLQKELIHTRPWNDLTEVRQHTFLWIEGYYNRRRRHSTPQYLTPIEYELGYRKLTDLAA
ncbi:MAG: DUF6262 family protein [Pseudonocardiaceae bacterium]